MTGEWGMGIEVGGRRREGATGRVVGGEERGVDCAGFEMMKRGMNSALQNDRAFSGALR